MEKDLLGEKIRLARLFRGYKQQYMGDKMGISQLAYSRLERRSSRMTVEQMMKIADILDVDYQDLLSEKEFVLYI
jgi:transcriptional regulator with XRE-family HTH domain